MPDSLGAALDALAADEVVRSALPGRLYKVFHHYKRDEWERYLAAVTDWERDEYLEVLLRALAMCGIAGIIYRNGNGEHRVGHDMTRMLQSMKHRGPDSTGYALYGPPSEDFVVRVKLADANTPRDFEFAQRCYPAPRRDRAPSAHARRAGQGHRGGERVLPGRDARLRRRPASASPTTSRTCPAPRCSRSGTRSRSSRTSATRRRSPRATASTGFIGSHAIGHVRMATESDVDISGAHPYWAYPFSDVAVVHNGQLTNYFQWRRRLERSGHRFQSECDSEIIAVYLAERMAKGDSLEDAMRQSLEELDGVFTYICVTEDALGVAKDELAAKPLVLYEGDDMVALASEEIAIRAVIDHEIDTYDPYEGEVMVWSR